MAILIRILRVPRIPSANDLLPNRRSRCRRDSNDPNKRGRTISSQDSGHRCDRQFTSTAFAILEKDRDRAIAAQHPAHTTLQHLYNIVNIIISRCRTDSKVVSLQMGNKRVDQREKDHSLTVRINIEQLLARYARLTRPTPGDR